MAPPNTHRAWLHLEPLFLHKTLGPAIEHSKEEGLSRQKPLSVGIRSLPTSPRQQARPHSPASGQAAGQMSSSCMTRLCPLIVNCILQPWRCADVLA